MTTTKNNNNELCIFFYYNNILSSSSQSIADSVTNTELDEGESSVVFAWNEGYPETARGIFYGSKLSAVPALANEAMLRRSGHKIGDDLWHRPSY